jgi:hypothetical protein
MNSFHRMNYIRKSRDGWINKDKNKRPDLPLLQLFQNWVVHTKVVHKNQENVFFFSIIMIQNRKLSNVYKVMQQYS